MALRAARILSSENDASVRTHQSTNVNIKLETPQVSKENFNLKESSPTMNGGIIYPSVAPNQVPAYVPVNEEQIIHQGQIPDVVYPPDNNVQYQSRDVDLAADIEDLEKKNQFLELLIEVYEKNPIRLNSYLICQSKTLMDMIKLLTDGDKVELILDDDVACIGCCSKSKYTYVSKILVTKNGKSEDLKYKYNDVYSKFIQHGISLKIII